MRRSRDLAVRVGQRFAELRARTKLSQADFAEHHGVSLIDLKRIEQGARDFRLSTIERMAIAVGMSLSDIIRLDGPGRPITTGRPRRAK